MEISFNERNLGIRHVSGESIDDFRLGCLFYRQLTIVREKFGPV